MSGERKFDENDPGWVRLDELRAILGIKHAQMQRIRKQLGNVHEHRHDKPGQPTWVYAPEWLRSWARLEAPVAVPQQQNDDDKIKALKLQREQFKFDCERRQFVSVEHAREIFDGAAATIRDALDSSGDPAFADLVVDRLQRAEKELKDRLSNGHGNGKPSR